VNLSDGDIRDIFSTLEDGAASASDTL